MSTLRSSRITASFAATAMVAAGFVGLGGSATAAVVDAPFNCTLPLLGAKVFTVSADAAFPARVEAGKSSSYTFTAKVAIPNDVRRDAHALLGTKVRGTASVPGKVGSSPVTVAADIPSIDIPAETGPLVVEVKGKGSFVAPAAGAATLTVQGFETALTFTKEGKDNGPLTITCSSAAPVAIGTVQVVKPAARPAPKAASKTTVKVRAKGKAATATVTVKSGKKAASGKVRVVLKKGKVTKKVTVALSRKGVAKATFKRLGKGAFRVTATYLGNASTATSSKSARGRI